MTATTTKLVFVLRWSLLLFICSAFTINPTTPSFRSRLFSTAETSQRMMIQTEYTERQLKDALDSLVENKLDAQHIYGYGDESHTMSMLQTITATRILDYAAYMSSPSAPSIETLLDEASEFAETHGPILNLRTVIQSQLPRMALAAEFKRASPSKGLIAPGLVAGEQAAKYAHAGANIVSVLTEEHWFQGTLGDMRQVRLATATERPAILRKDFVINEYMIAEAAANGADTVLLIVAVLPRPLLEALINYARSLGMEPLVEVHADDELQVALDSGAKVIGVNNRNLHTFQMDLTTTEHVAERMRLENKVFWTEDADYVVCALSGMSTAMDVHRYRQAGVHMCLIGESLMRAADPVAAIESLCLDPTDYETTTMAGSGAYIRGTQLVKVCGISNAEDALVACRAGANLVGIIFAPNSKRCVSVEQAKDVVNAVRTFGERSARMTLQSVTEQPQDALMNLVIMSRSLEAAARRPMVVGVFQNQNAEFIRDMVQECGLDLVQLHGKEGMAAANCANTGVPTIRVVDIETDPVTGNASASTVDDLLQSLTMDPVAILLDTSIKGAGTGGGTGVTFDWSICQKVQDAGLPVIIAGGLTPTNIQEAVMSVRPWGVDVSSGVEAAPGNKDHAKVQEFCKGVRDAAIEASKGF